MAASSVTETIKDVPTIEPVSRVFHNKCETYVLPVDEVEHRR